MKRYSRKMTTSFSARGMDARPCMWYLSEGALYEVRISTPTAHLTVCSEGIQTEQKSMEFSVQQVPLDTAYRWRLALLLACESEERKGASLFWSGMVNVMKEQLGKLRW